MESCGGSDNVYITLLTTSSVLTASIYTYSDATAKLVIQGLEAMTFVDISHVTFFSNFTGIFHVSCQTSTVNIEERQDPEFAFYLQF